MLESVTNSGQAKQTRTQYNGLGYNPLVTADTPGQTANLYWGMGGLVASKELQSGGNGTIYYRQPNWRGDVALSTNQSGGSAHQYFYSPYGQLLDNNSQLLDSSSFTGPHNRYTLAGKALDAESGLTYFGVRYYDAANGVWLTRDPVRGPLSDPTSRHAYLFNRSNPIRFTDLFGAYVVQPGDTLWDIAAQYGGSGTNWSALYAFNLNVVGGNPNLIYPGQDLYIPWGEEGSGWGRGGGGVAVPPPPLSNAKALCESGVANSWLPTGMVNWCMSVMGSDVVPPLPVDFSQQILNSGFVQSLFGIVGTPDWLKPRALTQVIGDRLCTSPLANVNECRKYLEDTYGVVVDIHSDITAISTQLTVLSKILRSVEALAGLAAMALNQYIPPYERYFELSDAFKMLFGPTHIYIERTRAELPLVCCNKEGALFHPSGINCGWEGQNCDHAGTGMWEIELSLDKLLKDGSITGVGLIAHEIAHNITYADGSNNAHLYGNVYLSKHPLTVDNKIIGSKGDVYQYMTVKAGQYSTMAFEFSADVIANLALSGFQNDNGAAQQHAWDWFTQNAGAFAHNMACTVGGQGYACSGNYDS